MFAIMGLVVTATLLVAAAKLFYASHLNLMAIPSRRMRRVMDILMVVLLVGGVVCGKGSLDGLLRQMEQSSAIENVQAAEPETPKAGAESEETAESNESSAEDDENFIQVKLSLDELMREYGHLREYYSRGTNPALAKDRAVLSGFEDAVNLPPWAEMEWFDIRDGLVREDADLTGIETSMIGRRLSQTDKQWRDELEAQGKTWKTAFDALTVDERVSGIQDWVIWNMINDPVYCDSWAQAFAVDPEITRQNPWLAEGLKRWDEYYDVTGKDLDKDLVGQDLVVQIRKEDAATVSSLRPEDIWKRLAYAEVTDEQFYYAARVATLYRYFTVKGFESKESWKNWHMPACADLSLTRTEEADYQESKQALVLWNRDKELNTRIEIGVNTLDGRPIVYQTTVHKTPDTKPTETPTTTSKKPTPSTARTPKTVTVHYRYLVNGKDAGEAAKDASKTLYEGEKYDIVSPKIAGYTASKDRMSGTMGKTSLEFTVWYTKQGTRTVDYELRIVYVKDNGESVQGDHVERLPEGAKYDVTSPTVAGWTADKPNVSGTMPAKDHKVVVTYTPDQKRKDLHNLDIRYVYEEDRSQAAAPHHETLMEGANFDVVSPAIEGYTPSEARISGTMGNEDLSFTVYYKKVVIPDPDPVLYELNIIYQYEDGSQAASPVHEKYAQGTPYSFDSKEIPGYTVDKPNVSGTMPAQDVTEIVTYRKKGDGNGAKDPAEEPTHKTDGDGDKGGGDNSENTFGTEKTPEEKDAEEAEKRRKDEEAKAAEEAERRRQEEEQKEQIQDQEGGETHDEQPEISTEDPDTDHAEGDTATEEKVTDNGDGTTTTEVETVKPEEEISDGELKLDD